MCVRQNIFWTALPLPKVHLRATYNRSSHLRILSVSSSWIWGETLIKYNILLKEMLKRTQCPVPKLFASDCCRGENEFFSVECHTGYQSKASPMPSMWLANTKKMPMPCLLLCFFSLMFLGERGGMYFHSLSPIFSLFRLFDFHLEWWFDYFLCIFLFLMRKKRRRRERMKWGV